MGKKKAADENLPKLPPRYLDSPLRLLAVSLETLLDKAMRAVRRWEGRTKLPLTISKHNTLGFPGGIILQGRVMAARRLRQPKVSDSAWVNLARMLRHWLTDEEPYAKVEASCQGVIKETNADEEGYFEIVFDHPEVDQAEEIQWRLPFGESSKWRKASILRPPTEFDFLIISDIDDTILETNAASVVKMVKTTLFGNVLTRQVFEGVPDFYHRLVGEGNPMFYVTSSPWNLRGFIRSIFDRNNLPKGGFFMTDWGLDKEKWFTKCHRSHKLGAIQKVFDWHPNKPAIVIGDSGQKDPEIYAELAELFPERVKLILIRNATKHRPWREHEVEKLATKTREAGIPYQLCHDTEEMEKAFDEIDM